MKLTGPLCILANFQKATCIEAHRLSINFPGEYIPTYVCMHAAYNTHNFTVSLTAKWKALIHTH